MTKENNAPINILELNENSQEFINSGINNNSFTIETNNKAKRLSEEAPELFITPIENNSIEEELSFIPPIESASIGGELSFTPLIDEETSSTSVLLNGEEET